MQPSNSVLNGIKHGLFKHSEFPMRLFKTKFEGNPKGLYI